jgi:hypothetical protein
VRLGVVNVVGPSQRDQNVDVEQAGHSAILVRIRDHLRRDGWGVGRNVEDGETILSSRALRARCQAAPQDPRQDVPEALPLRTRHAPSRFEDVVIQIDGGTHALILMRAHHDVKVP